MDGDKVEVLLGAGDVFNSGAKVLSFFPFLFFFAVIKFTNVNEA